MNLSFPLMLKSFKKRPKLFSSAAVIILTVLIFFLTFAKSSDDEKKWAIGVKGTFTVDIVESGEIRAVEAEFVRAPQEWQMDLQIIDIAPEGTIVKEGDFLVQFDTSTLDEELGNLFDNLKQAEADLRSIDSQQANRLFEMETDLKIAHYSLEAAELQTGLLKYESKNKREEARIDLEKAQIRYGEAEEKIETRKIIDKAERMKIAVKFEQAKALVEQMKKRIDIFMLRAPISGMVVYHEIGGYGSDNPRYKPSIGDKVRSGATIISIPDLSKMKLVVKLNEMDAGKLNTGEKVFVWLEAFEDVEYHGIVDDISSLVEKGSIYSGQAAEAPSFEVSILIEETDEMLKPGMTAQAKIILEEIPDIVSIPVGTVFEDNNGSPVVYIRKSFPTPVPVKLGRRNDRFVIVEEGLREGVEVSWSPPPESSHPLGWFTEMERRRTEFQDYVIHIETMNELGITYDPSQADSTVKETDTTDKSKAAIIQEKKQEASSPVVKKVIK